jgi:hypothetical protein
MKIPVLIGLLAAACLAPAAAQNVGLPYLKRPALTATALADQVSADPQLRARYSKHFQSAPAPLISALRAARPLTLAPGTYTVWLTGRNGLRYPTVQRRAGQTPAFAVSLKAGADPVWLEAGSGNPIERFQPVEEIEVVEEELPPARIVEREALREVLVAVGTDRPAE